jgi:copper type II ascorbate-dependent monooxygenase-like protein
VLVPVVGVVAALVVTACASRSGDSTGIANHTGHHGAPATPAPELPLRSGERFVNLTTARPYTPSAPHGGTDEYRCLLVDPQLTKPEFLTGSQFQPQNVSILHHAIIFVVPPQDAAAARAKDAATPGDGWTCFGGAELSTNHQAEWVGAWTPNGRETVLKQNAGFPLEPGSLMLLQIHYNLLATGGHAGATDQSGVRLRLTDGTAATKRLSMIPLEAPIELPCADGESGPLCDRAAAVADVAKRFGADVGEIEAQLVRDCGLGRPVPGDTQHCDYPVPRPMTVYGAFGHMHLLGRSMKVELNPGTAHARTLLDVPNFDFDNQRLRPLATPVDVEAGDTVRVTCTHDAKLRELLPQLSTLPPRYVVWGDGTSDEMCLGLLIASIKA